ncbi:MAG: DoxX family membrane protein [Bacteroidetes bacterium]|nr:DoxX family membrane protein [Bacteroidota bacterium]
MYQQPTVTVDKRALLLLRISIGVIYIWFGGLKFFHGYSPAESLAINTINKLTFNLIPNPANIVLLAIWECLVGILLIAGKAVKTALVLMFIHMICTFTPLLFFPGDSFKYPPYGFTLVGQYIMKNLILICAALVIWPAKKNEHPSEKNNEIIKRRHFMLKEKSEKESARV